MGVTAHAAGQVEAYAEPTAPFGRIVAVDDGPRDITPLKTKSIAWHWERMFTRPMLQTADMIEQHNLLNAVAELVDRGTVGKIVIRGWA